MKKIVDLNRMADDDMEMVTEMIVDYLEKGRVLISDLYQAVADANFVTVREIAHQMRTPSSYLGAEQLTTIFCEIEECAVNTDIEGLAYQMEIIDNEWDEVVGELREIAKKEK